MNVSTCDNQISNKYVSLFDDLTGLPNRRAFLEYLEQHIELSVDYENQLFAVLVLGVENFGVINSSLGIHIGDQLLVQIGKRLQEVIRVNDCLFRVGGDEYVVVIHDIKSVTSLDKFAARIYESLLSSFHLEDNEIFIGIRLGITHNQVSAGKAEDFFRDACAAMNHAKSSESLHCVVFQPKIQEEFEHHLDLANSLRKALNRDELFLEYQPIFSLSEEFLVGFEALVRWKHPRWGVLSPDKFIPLAEKSQLIEPLGEWVLQEACRQLKSWQEQFSEARKLSISVNVSVRQILCGDFHKKVSKALKIANLKPKFLSLEITESVLLEHSQQTLLELEKVKSLGVKIAIDDFGTGYSSLSYLLDFPCDILKLDASFTDDVDNNHRKFYLVQSLLALGQGLGVEVTAEGLETQEQLAHFRALGCNYGQGYIFSKPLNTQNSQSFILSHISANKILGDIENRHSVSNPNVLPNGYSFRDDLLTKNQYLEMKINNLAQEVDDLKNLLSTAESHAEVIESQLYQEVSEHQKTFLKLEESNLELRRLSYIDPLTQIPNRRYFDEHLCQAWENAIFLQDSISMIIVDVDYFKLYNDEYGHRTGDFCLLQIAQTLSDALISSTDFVARYGGEEFAIICSGLSQEDVVEMAQRICTTVISLKLQHCRSPVSSYVTVSAGVANIIPQESNSINDFFQRADKALYSAKQSGRNGFSLATSMKAIF
ncbi:MAG: diguanylate cyclase [Synechococcus sp.]